MINVSLGSDLCFFNAGDNNLVGMNKQKALCVVNQFISMIIFIEQILTFLSF